ncbi:hypothetical protein CCH79_00018720 [Gambusia affinis]|uniref:Peptidase S1 domain-containing protein n=1 Tax=Gambusia affinis TaxID=33528 RepID=A0A315WDX4_GAMAF|nr:hypothetical protein CCH79_00018720 [Gambusia affinis]
MESWGTRCKEDAWWGAVTCRSDRKTPATPPDCLNLRQCRSSSSGSGPDRFMTDMGRMGRDDLTCNSRQSSGEHGCRAGVMLRVCQANPEGWGLQRLQLVPSLVGILKEDQEKEDEDAKLSQQLEMPATGWYLAHRFTSLCHGECSELASSEFTAPAQENVSELQRSRRSVIIKLAGLRVCSVTSLLAINLIMDVCLQSRRTRRISSKKHNWPLFDSELTGKWVMREGGRHAGNRTCNSRVKDKGLHMYSQVVLRVHSRTGGRKISGIQGKPVVYAPEGWHHDIILLKLPRQQIDIPLAPLPDCSNRPKIGDTVQLAGEGATTTGPNNRHCEKNIKGDAGSAVVFNGMIYGVISPGLPVYACERPVLIMDVCEYIGKPTQASKRGFTDTPRRQPIARSKDLHSQEAGPAMALLKVLLLLGLGESEILDTLEKLDTLETLPLVPGRLLLSVTLKLPSDSVSD